MNVFKEAFLELAQERSIAGNQFVPGFDILTETLNKMLERYGQGSIDVCVPIGLTTSQAFWSRKTLLHDACANFVTEWNSVLRYTRYNGTSADSKRAFFGRIPGQTIMESIVLLVKEIETRPHLSLWRCLALMLSCLPSSGWIYHESKLVELVISQFREAFNANILIPDLPIHVVLPRLLAKTTLLPLSRFVAQPSPSTQKESRSLYLTQSILPGCNK